MEPEDNKVVMRQFFEAVSGKDKPRGLLARFVKDEELIQHVLMFEAAFPRYEISADDLVAEGNKVAVRVTFRGRHQGPLMGIAPTERQVTQSGLLLYELEDGKIIRHWTAMDRLELLQQLGVASDSAGTGDS